MKQSVFKYKTSSQKRSKVPKTKVASGESLIYWMNFLIPMNFFYCLLLFVYQIQVQEVGGSYEPFRYLCSCLFFLALYVVVRKANKLGWIIGMDMALICLVIWQNPLPGSPLLLAGVMAAYAIVQLIGRGDPDDPAKGIVREIYFKINDAYWGIGIWIVMFLNGWMSRGARDKAIAEECSAWLLLVFVIYFAEYLFQKYNFLLFDYFSRFRQRDQLDQTFRKRFLLFGGACGACIAVGLLTISGLLTRPLAGIVALLARFWNRFLQSYNPNTESFLMPWNTPVPVVSGEKEKAMEVLERAGRNSEMANRIALPILFVLFLIVVVIVARYILKLLSKGRYSPEREEDVITFVKKEGNETATPAVVFRRIRYGNSTNEQVRRYYNRTILWKNRKKKINRLNKLTPRELSRRLSESAKEKQDLESLTLLYEEARYNNGMISREKAAKARALYKESVK